MAAFHSPVLETMKSLVRSLLGRAGSAEAGDESLFRGKYVAFQELLESNTELLRTIAALEEKLPGRDVFGMSFLNLAASQSVFHGMRMIRAFESLSGRPQPVLFANAERIRQELKDILHVWAPPPGPWFLPLAQVDASKQDLAGGKASNLGEAAAKLGLPTPSGFVVTTAAFRDFLAHSGLSEEIAKRAMSLEPGDPVSIQQASEDIQRIMLLEPLPENFEEGLLEMFDDLADRLGQSPDSFLCAMRSSAVGEDGELSFAGQYLSMLGVTRKRVVESYRYVAASLYTPRALSYRLLKGVPDEASAMAVVCLSMVDSQASGVMYTRHPYDREDRDILINAVWGLGPYAVDGVVTPDVYRVSKDGRGILDVRPSNKPVLLATRPGGGTSEIPVAPDRAETTCLDFRQIEELAQWGRRLEEHFGKPQDVEWALDGHGLVLLQTRPLGDASGTGRKVRKPPVPDRQVLLEGGEAASPGAGCGPVKLVESDDDLTVFPDGAVLVASHSSPRFMVTMKKARAIVTDHGSITGHMASLAREFGVPTILGLEGATRTLTQGSIITVDADNRRIYLGTVQEILTATAAEPAPMLGSPVHGVLKGIYSLVGPLNLLDPKAPEFAPASCHTLHDMARLLHEWSYSEMFRLGDRASGEGGFAVRLDAGIGLDLYLIDLGGGLAEGAGRDRPAGQGDILSRPFKALMEGLAHENYVHKGPRPVNIRGFLSVMGRQMAGGPDAGGERFGDKSYAIVSDRYLNFSSRVGYHYGALDCYCGQTVNKNYITFAFKGGAAGEERRERRARAIALILKRLGFVVAVNSDRVEGRFQKYPPEVIEERLVSLGKLLQFTRQTDMLMTDENAVKAMAQSFLEGETVFGPSV